jgi:hypothetical protein
MTDAVDKAELAVPFHPIIPPSAPELAALEAPDPEYTDAIDLDEDDDEIEEVEETEVTAENYKLFLPVYDAGSTPEINLILGAGTPMAGFMTPAAQEEYEQPTPGPQESYEDEEGV